MPKRLLLILGIIIGVIAILAVVLWVRAASVSKAARNAEGLTGLRVDEEAIDNAPSDIDGMTKGEKAAAGMGIQDGADSDHDGLTDKEELEVYHSDPLKASTADDLYLDGYKVAHDMDVNTYYEYEGSRDVTFEEFPEVKTEAKIATDFNAQCVSGAPVDTDGVLNGVDIYKSYTIGYFSGPVMIDVSEIAEENDVAPEDIHAYVGHWTGADMKEADVTLNGSVMEIATDFSNANHSLVLGSKQSLGGKFGNAKQKFGDALGLDIPDTSRSKGTEENKPTKVLFTSGAINFFGMKPTIKYVPGSDDAEVQETMHLARTVANFYTGYKPFHGFEFAYVIDYPDFEQVSELEYKWSHFVNAVFLPLFHLKTLDDFGGVGVLGYYWWDENDINNSDYMKHIDGGFDLTEDELNHASVDWIVSLGFTGKIEYERSKYINGKPYVAHPKDPNKLQVWTGFGLDDMFNFKNFGTIFSEGGNCAGLSLMAGKLYNDGSLAETGSYTFHNFYDWGDITVKYDESYCNKTLRDRGVDGLFDGFAFSTEYDKRAGHNWFGETYIQRGPDCNEYDRINFDMVFAPNWWFSVYSKGVHNPNYVFGGAGGDDRDDWTPVYNFMEHVTVFHEETNDAVTGDMWFDTANGDEMPYSLVETLKEQLNEGKVTILGISGENEDRKYAHAVDVIGYSEDPWRDGYTEFCIYDCNHPREYRYLYTQKRTNASGEEVFDYYYDGGRHVYDSTTCGNKIKASFGLIDTDLNALY